MEERGAATSRLRENYSSEVAATSYPLLPQRLQQLASAVALFPGLRALYLRGAEVQMCSHAHCRRYGALQVQPKCGA